MSDICRKKLLTNFQPQIKLIDTWAKKFNHLLTNYISLKFSTISNCYQNLVENLLVKTIFLSEIWSKFDFFCSIRVSHKKYQYSYFDFGAKLFT